MIVALGIVVCALCLGFVAVWWPRRRLWMAARDLPGPKPRPVVGNMFDFVGDNKFVFKSANRLMKEHGSVVRLWLGPDLYVLLSDPTDIAAVLSNPVVLSRGALINKVIGVFGDEGLLTVSGDIWRAHRRVIAPAFHQKILETYVEVFADKAATLIGRLDKLDDGREFDVYEYLAVCTMDAVCETAIGCKKHGQENDDSSLVKLLEEHNALVARRVSTWYYHVDWLYPYTGDGRKTFKLVKRLRAFSEDIIAKKLSDYRAGVRRSNTTTSGSKQINSFLDMMIDASESAGSVLSAEALRDEVSALLAAGTETTAKTMAFTLLLLAMHPDIQDQLFNEVSSILCDARAPSGEEMKEMQLLERCIKESMRLLPVAPVLLRELPEDLAIGRNRVLPAGTQVMVFVYAVHRDAEHYPEPNTYDPDRWLPGNNLHKFAYLPFSAGVRSCMGNKFAMMEMKSTLCAIVQRYKMATSLKMADLNDLEMGVTLHLCHPKGYALQLTRRDSCR